MQCDIGRTRNKDGEDNKLIKNFYMKTCRGDIAWEKYE